MNILYGICGLGRGHTMRQLPVITELAARGHKLAIFAYGESLAFFAPWAKGRNIPVYEVAVPFVVGTSSGIDLEATRQHPANQRDFAAFNAPAKAMALKHLGKPDLIITDYEPTAAEVAYAHDIPLITLDQQSKFLLAQSNLPPVLDGLTPVDEIARLRHFFPRAALRLACSFFKVEGTGDVTIIPPPLRHDIRSLTRNPSRTPTLTVYATTTNGGLNMDNLLRTLGHFPRVKFNLFTRHAAVSALPGHVTACQPSHQAFLQSLSQSHGIITSAGHSLLSEAMHLGIPVLALPTAVYEQKLNAQIIHQYKLGLSSASLSPHNVSDFLDNLPHFQNSISHHPQLLKDTNPSNLIKAIEQLSLNPS